MTPALTNAQKYSSDFGFSPGVVVEVTISDNYQIVAYYHSIDNESVLFLEPSKKGIRARYPKFDEIKSIRLLSGRWAVWQFAPKWAVGVRISKSSYVPIAFFDDEKTYDYAASHADSDYTYLPAPWWWLEGRK